MSKTKHTHHLALEVVPRPPLQRVYCPGCGERFYTVETQTGVEVELRNGAAVVRTPKKGKRGADA